MDFLIQTLAGCALFAIASRMTRPIFGLIAAAAYSIQYVGLGSWYTANRETYQIALILLVMAWLLCDRPASKAEGWIAFFSWILMALTVFINPTIGLVMFPILFLVCRPPVADAEPKRRWLRFWCFLLGGSLFSLAILLIFLPHGKETMECLFGYNLDVYSQAGGALPGKTALFKVAQRHLLEYVYLLPILFLVVSPEARKPLTWISILFLCIALDIAIQNKFFHYHLWALAPFRILWTVMLKDKLCELAWRGRRRFFPHSAVMGFLAMLACLAIVYYVPKNAIFGLSGYPWKSEDAGSPPGSMPSIWESASAWLGSHTVPGERVYVVGLDFGTQFLADIPPLSRIANGVLAYQNAALNESPFVLKAKRTQMEDLGRQPPDWILVATYDSSWYAKSGWESIRTFPEFKAFLATEYAEMPEGLEDYRIFRLRGPGLRASGDFANR
jgi:hypothetical protein